MKTLVIGVGLATVGVSAAVLLPAASVICDRMHHRSYTARLQSVKETHAQRRGHRPPPPRGSDGGAAA
jgi:hypothetical protein